MRHHSLLLFLSFLSLCLALNSCYQAPSFPQDRRTNKQQLSVVTYNAEWLFLANSQDPSLCPEAGCPYSTLQQAIDHVEAIANEIRLLDADVVNLVEVEGCDVLELLIEKIGTSYGYRAYLIQGDDTYTGQNVALLTRVDPLIDLQRTDAEVNYPVPNSACSGHYPGGDYGVSKNYYTQLNVSNSIVNLFSVHFLAFPDDSERCFKREAQATVMKNYMLEQVSSGSEYTIVFGDFNDFDPDLLDTAGDVPISSVLEIIKTAFPSTIYSNSLFNIGTTVKYQSQRFSNWWDQNDDCDYSFNELSAIDHTLVDPKLSTMMLEAKYVHNYQPTCETAISDHYPIRSLYQLN